MTDRRHETRGHDTRGPDPDLLRAEAERLVAAGLAAVSMAADRIGAPTRERGGAAAAGFDALGDMLFGPSMHRRHSVANGSPECCLCPVCRVIAAARQPNPTFADRLATGVGTVAGSAAKVFRGVAGAADAVRQHRDTAATSGPDPWATATAESPATASPTTASPAATTPTIESPTTVEAPTTVTVTTVTTVAAGDEPDPWAAATTATETAGPATTAERPDTTGPTDR